MFSRPARSKLSALFLALIGLGCEGEDPIAPPVPTTLVATSNTSAAGIAGGQATPLPTVTVTDQRGDPMNGVEVTFSVTAGGGTVTGAVQRTNASGVGAVGGWTLGAIAGANTVVATSGSLPPVTFTATGTVGAPASVTKSGDGQSATVNSRVPVPPKIIVKDINGNVVPGIRVDYVVHATSPSTAGEVSPPSRVTDASGEASVEWTLARRAGTNTLTATVSGLPAVTFTATGTPGPVAFAFVEPGFFGILIGDTVTVRASPHDSYLNAISGLVNSWEPAEPVVSISAEGLLTGLSSGHARVTASYGAVAYRTGAADVIVYGRIDSTSFVFTPTGLPVQGWTEPNLQLGATTCRNLYAFGSARRSDAAPWTPALRWTPMVSDPSIVSVTSGNQPGLHCFRALRSGTVTVNGTFGGATASRTLTVP